MELHAAVPGKRGRRGQGGARQTSCRPPTARRAEQHVNFRSGECSQPGGGAQRFQGGGVIVAAAGSPVELFGHHAVPEEEVDIVLHVKVAPQVARAGMLHLRKRGLARWARREPAGVWWRIVAATKRRRPPLLARSRLHSSAAPPRELQMRRPRGVLARPARPDFVRAEAARGTGFSPTGPARRCTRSRPRSP